MEKLIERLRAQLSEGAQVYWVCPLIESSDVSELAAAEERHAHLAQLFGKDNVGLLHGGMQDKAKDAAMEAFSDGRLQILVATTVIEVGVNVPNANIMVIEHAERFGLAQLHQLRGRVGRGPHASTCLLVAHGRVAEEAQARLDVMLRTDDGFAIAEKDLELRGPGDFFGTRQWGMPRFRVAHLVRDRELLEQARAEAYRYAEAVGEESLRAVLERAGWERRFGLARVG
jgi:ATP-dependent DNA helicase RecG